MLQDLALHCGAFHYRCADFNLTVVVCEQDFVETYGRIFFALKTVDIKFPTFFSFKLLTCKQHILQFFLPRCASGTVLGAADAAGKAGGRTCTEY